MNIVQSHLNTAYDKIGFALILFGILLVVASLVVISNAININCLKTHN